VVGYVICVFPAEPVLWCEEPERTEGRGAADYGLVVAEEGHGEDIVGGEVEYWGLGVEASNGSFGVDGQILLLFVSD
jgi:hypothetical protein